MVDQLSPDAAPFYVYLIVIGGIALAAGYAMGWRLRVGALLVISVASGIAVFFLGFLLGAAVLSSIILAIVAMVFLQVGYFLGAVTRPATSSETSSADQSVNTEA